MIEKIFSWTLDIMLILFAVLFLTFTILASYSYYFDTKIIKEYKENWERGPILDIIKTDTICPMGYDYFIVNSFPGNIDGCDCTSTTDEPYKGKVYDKTCDSLQTASGCKMIMKSEEIPLTTWRGTKLCVLRMTKNFWQLTISNVNCAEGMKKCGLLDTFGNTLCVMPNELCPINDVIISNEKQITGYSNIKLNNGFYIHYTHNKLNSQIIVEIEARQNPVCVHPYEGELGENNYVLNTKKGPSECTTQINNNLIDTRFSVLDSENLYDFYNENNIAKVISKLPSYPMPKSSSTATLYKINYFGWNKKCFNDNHFQPSNLVTPQEIVNSYSTKTYFLAVWAAIHFFFILMSIVLYKIIFEKMRVSMLIVFLIDICNLIFLVVFFTFIIIVLQGTDNILAPNIEFITHKCGDAVTNDVLDESFSGIKNVKGYLVPNLILSVIESAYIVGYYLWMCIIKNDQFR